MVLQFSGWEYRTLTPKKDEWTGIFVLSTGPNCGGI
jgi:hypothetical protein